MKNKKQILLLAAVFGMLFTSCSENEVNTDETSVQSTLKGKSSYTLTTNFSTNSFELNELSTFNSKVENYGIYKEIETQQVLLETSDFEALLNDFSSFYGVNLSGYNLRGVVFYGNEVSINLTDFRNLTLIVLDNDGYAKYISFEKQGSSLVLVENNSQKHSFIMMNYFGYLGSKLNLNNNSMLTIINKKDFGLNVDPQIDVNVQSQNIDKTIINEYEIIPYSYITTGRTYCTMQDCDSTDRGYCSMLPDDTDVECHGGPSLDEQICNNDRGGQHYDHYVLAPSGYKAAMYGIRDGFLMQTEKGKEYVDFYYKLSFCFHYLNIYDSKRDSMIDLINKMRSKSLVFMMADSDDVIVTEAEYTYLKGRINEFKVLTSNEEYRYIFNKMDSDLDYLKNKTKTQLQNYFND